MKYAEEAHHSSCCGSSFSIYEDRERFGIKCDCCDSWCGVLTKRDRPYLAGDVIEKLHTRDTNTLLIGLRNLTVKSCRKSPEFDECDVTLYSSINGRNYHLTCNINGQEFMEETPF